MTFTFRPAARENVGLLIALAGASGSGKTYSALRLAKGLAGDGKIAFIDTEARRGLHYADRFDFLHADMRPPFRPERFVEGIRAAEEAGATVVILDSASHEYDGEGGILDWAAELEEGTPKPGIENPRDPARDRDGWKDWLVKPIKSPGNWKEPKLAHKRMVNALLQMRAHLIFCLRADEKIKIERVKDEHNRERTVVTPLGWMPICEKRFMFEMTASFTLIPSAPGIPQLDLPHKLQDQHREMFPQGKPIGEDAGVALAAWARGGGDQQRQARPQQTQQTKRDEGSAGDGPQGDAGQPTGGPSAMDGAGGPPPGPYIIDDKGNRRTASNIEVWTEGWEKAIQAGQRKKQAVALKGLRLRNAQAFAELAQQWPDEVADIQRILDAAIASLEDQQAAA